MGLISLNPTILLRAVKDLTARIYLFSFFLWGTKHKNQLLLNRKNWRPLPWLWFLIFTPTYTPALTKVWGYSSAPINTKQPQFFSPKGRILLLIKKNENNHRPRAFLMESIKGTKRKPRSIPIHNRGQTKHHPPPTKKKKKLSKSISQ